MVKPPVVAAVMMVLVASGRGSPQDTGRPPRAMMTQVAGIDGRLGFLEVHRALPVVT